MPDWRQRSAVCIAFLGLLQGCPQAFAGTIAGLSPNPHAMDPNRACGPYCLLFLDHYYGGTRGYDTIARLCPPGPLGTSLHDVKVAAQHCGMHSEGVKGSLARVLATGIPAILHLESPNRLNHFVVLLGQHRDNDELLIFSPPCTLGYVAHDRIESQFTGIALLISNDRIRRSASRGSHWHPLEWCLIVLPLVLGCAVVRLLPRAPSATGRTNAICLVAGAVTLSAAGCEQPQVTSNGNRPPDERRTVDVGEVDKGVDLHHVFAIRNTTDRILTITGVEKSCTCQDVDVNVGESITPGAVRRVSFRVPSSKLIGPQSGRLTIHTDSPHEDFRTIHLSLRGNIRSKLRAIPSQLVFGIVQASEASHKELRIESVIPGLLDTFESALCDSPWVEIQSRGSVPGARVFSVSVSPELPVGELRDVVVFRFDDERYPQLVVDILARKLPPVSAVPSQLTLGDSQFEGSQEFRILVKSNTKEAFRIKRVTSSQGITVSGTDQEARRAFALTVSVGEPPRESQRKEVVIHTDHPHEVIVPIDGPSRHSVGEEPTDAAHPIDRPRNDAGP